MSTSLDSLIEQLLAFVQAHRAGPDGRHFVEGAEWERLRQLDADFFAACYAEGLPLPKFPPPERPKTKLFGNCKMPYSIGPGYVLVWPPSLEWEQAMRGLLALTRSRRQPPEQSHKRGRKPRYNQDEDREIAEAWERAKGADFQKKQFAHDKNLSLRELNRLLNRNSKRNRARK